MRQRALDGVAELLIGWWYRVAVEFDNRRRRLERVMTGSSSPSKVARGRASRRRSAGWPRRFAATGRRSRRPASRAARRPPRRSGRSFFPVSAKPLGSRRRSDALRRRARRSCRSASSGRRWRVATGCSAIASSIRPASIRAPAASIRSCSMGWSESRSATCVPI